MHAIADSYGLRAVCATFRCRNHPFISEFETFVAATLLLLIAVEMEKTSRSSRRIVGLTGLIGFWRVFWGSMLGVGIGLQRVIWVLMIVSVCF